MIDRIKEMIANNTSRQAEIIANNAELLWASIFHDSIRGKKAVENLPLNIGRWAGGYPFFYVLNRILSDYQPKRILEFGLGESSKFVSTYLDNYLLDSEHIVIEQDVNWKSVFENNFKVSQRTKIKVMPLVTKNYKNFDFNGYENIENEIQSKFDLYIIDGPFGSPKFSRFDIYELAKILTDQDHFIIVIDDYNRKGEQETTHELLKLFENRNIKVYSAVYNGLKSLMVIGSQKYKYIGSL